MRAVSEQLKLQDGTRWAPTSYINGVVNNSPTNGLTSG